jgi:holo-[acyl-carrier protein] synthase
VKRIAKLLDENGERLKNKIFTSREIDYCDKKPNPHIHYSGRFAAKESIKKCLLSSKIINQIDLKQIEIISMDGGEPVVSKLNNINYRSIKVSISHENDYAIAFSILKK